MKITSKIIEKHFKTKLSKRYKDFIDSEEYNKYGRNRLSEGKLPLCAEMCSTKALLAGDADVLSDIYRKRVINRGASAFDWGVNFNNVKIQG